MSRTGRVRLAAALITAGAACAASPAMAHDETLFSDGGTLPGFEERHLGQHGVTAGHLPATQSKTVGIISKLSLKNVEEGKIADIGVSPNGNTAFLAAWGGQTCTKNGVHVVDISNPKAPLETSFIPSKEGSYAGEGVQAVDISTPEFTGTVLVTNNEICKDKAGFGGMNIYNVTNPKNPTPLAVGIGDTTVNGQGKKAANEIHSVFAWDAGEKAYAVMVDNEEGKDVDIMDITNPKLPVLVAEYDLDETFPQIKQAAPSNLEEIFLHDMVVKEIGGRQIMMASYWDAGYVKLDVTDPKAITYLGDTDFTNPDPEAAESGLIVPPEGNGHQAEFTLDNSFVLGSDEDFAPYALKAENTTDATALTASQGSDTPRLVEGETITGQSVFAGRACAADPAVPKGNGTQIAVVERGVCTFTEKVASVEKATGYKAVLIFNREGTDACRETLGMSVEGSIPTFGVAPRDQGFAIFDAAYDQAKCLAGTGGQAPIALGKTGDTLTFASYFDGWGYVHLFANTTGKMAELDTYAIPEAHDPKFASGFGDLSVHEVATSKKNANVAYFSYYSGGFRVVNISSGKIVETGRSIDQGGNNLWGVEVFDDGGTEYVAASDRDKGLYIYKYTAPTP